MEDLKDKKLPETNEIDNTVRATIKPTARGTSLPYLQDADGNLTTFENPQELIGRTIIEKDSIITHITHRPRMILNPNRAVVDAIIKRIFLNDMKCPCQPGDTIEDTRCPCKDFYIGNCHCSLFIPDKK